MSRGWMVALAVLMACGGVLLISGWVPESNNQHLNLVRPGLFILIFATRLGAIGRPTRLPVGPLYRYAMSQRATVAY